LLSLTQSKPLSNFPTAMTSDTSGNLFLGCCDMFQGGNIVRVTGDGKLSTVATLLEQTISGLAVNKEGEVHFSSANYHMIGRIGNRVWRPATHRLFLDHIQKEIFHLLAVTRRDEAGCRLLERLPRDVLYFVCQFVAAISPLEFQEQAKRKKTPE